MNIAFFYGVKRYSYLFCIPGLQITAYSASPGAFPGMLLFPCLTGVSVPALGLRAWAAHSECSGGLQRMDSRCALTMLLL